MNNKDFHNHGPRLTLAASNLEEPGASQAGLVLEVELVLVCQILDIMFYWGDLRRGNAN